MPISTVVLEVIKVVVCEGVDHHIDHVSMLS
jgi:hypothetical protein